MLDDRVMAKALNTVGEQPSTRQRYARRKKGQAEERFGEEGDYRPDPQDRPDPTQPLLEALDRIRAVERPSDTAYLAALRGMRAYQDPTTRTERARREQAPPAEAPARPE
jgi:hypothetical protein